ncbi:MAG: hypothetical protein JWL90_2017 [Chthoniobacteraceae bacterium]|nr:hypothetical protein [Chthoniobacteraceae bacterium]
MQCGSRFSCRAPGEVSPSSLAGEKRVWRKLPTAAAEIGRKTILSNQARFANFPRVPPVHPCRSLLQCSVIAKEIAPRYGGAAPCTTPIRQSESRSASSLNNYIPVSCDFPLFEVVGTSTRRPRLKHVGEAFLKRLFPVTYLAGMDLKILGDLLDGFDSFESSRATRALKAESWVHLSFIPGCGGARLQG